MRWYELAENSRAISEIYTTVPPLQNVHLKDVTLDHNGPRIIFLIDLSVFPDKVPPRWKIQKYNMVQLQLDFWMIESVQITRWPTNNQMNIHIEQTSNQRIAVEALSPRCSIQLIAHDFRIILHKKFSPSGEA